MENFVPRYLVGKPLLSGAMRKNESSEEWFVARAVENESISIMALPMDGKCFQTEGKRSEAVDKH